MKPVEQNFGMESSASTELLKDGISSQHDLTM